MRCSPRRTKPTLSGRSQLPLQQDAQVKVLTVFTNGDIHLTGGTFVSIGRTHAGSRVTVLFDGDHVTVYRPTGSPSATCTSTGPKPDNNSDQLPNLCLTTIYTPVSHNYVDSTHTGAC
jgi:hypothetical protein